MEAVELLVLNCGGRHVSECLVHSVGNLNEACRFDVREALLPPESQSWRDTVSTMLASNQPDVLLLAFNWEHFSRAEEVLELLSVGLPEAPMIVATDVTDPNRLYKVLQWAASNFLTPPFR